MTMLCNSITIFPSACHRLFFLRLKRFRMPSHTFPRASSEANWAISAEQNVTHRIDSPPPKAPKKPHCAFYLYQFKFDFRSPFRFHSRRLHFALMRFVCRTRRTSIAACFLNDFIMKSPLRWLIVVKLKYL